MRNPKDSRGLTKKQEQYCRERAFTDKNQTECYMSAFDSHSKRAATESASRLSKLEFIQKRIAELQAQVDAGAVLNAQQIQAEVANIAMDPESTKGIRLKAFDQLAKMQGAYSDNLNLHTSGSMAVSLGDKKDAIKALLGEDNDS